MAENWPRKGVETRCGGRGATRPTASAARCGGRGATRPTASAARMRAPFSGCALRFNTDAVKGLSLTASLPSDSSAIFIWLRMLFSLTTKRGCASSCVPHDERRGIVAAIEACRLRASSLSHRSPFGLAAQPRHENALRATRKSLPPAVDGTKILRVLSSEQVGVKMRRAERFEAFLELQVNNHGVRFQTKQVATPPKSKVQSRKSLSYLASLVRGLTRSVWFVASIHRLVRPITPRSALLEGSIHRLVRSIKPRSVFVQSTEGLNVFVSRSAFVTSARAKPEGLARMPSSRPKPLGFEPGDDGSRVNRACAMPVRSVRGQGVWGPRPHESVLRPHPHLRDQKFERRAA